MKEQHQCNCEEGIQSNMDEYLDMDKSDYLEKRLFPFSDPKQFAPIINDPS